MRGYPHATCTFFRISAANANQCSSQAPCKKKCKPVFPLPNQPACWRHFKVQNARGVRSAKLKLQRQACFWNRVTLGLPLRSAQGLLRAYKKQICTDFNNLPSHTWYCRDGDATPRAMSSPRPCIQHSAATKFHPFAFIVSALCCCSAFAPCLEQPQHIPPCR